MSKKGEEGVLGTFQGKFRCFLMIGAPGAGKGTLAKNLAEVGGHLHVSTGDIYRGLDAHSPAGQLADHYMKQGLFMPDAPAMAIWRSYMHGLIATNRYFPSNQVVFLDGVPRSLEQVHLIQDDVDFLAVLHLEMKDEDKLIERLKKRAVIEGRKDDADEAVLRKRLEVYNEKTAAILDHFPKNRVLTINADQSKLGVLRDALTAIIPLL